MSIDDNLDKILKRYTELNNKLSLSFSGEESIKISKEYAELSPIVEKINERNKVVADLVSTELMLQEPGVDSETYQMIQEDIARLKNLLPEINKAVQDALLSKDEVDAKGAIIEVRAGTGGKEAALFAAELFLMYKQYATSKKWNFEVLYISNIDGGGCKEASALVSGHNVFKSLKFESGVHRVQRVPETESSGRIHTSAATVAVLPEAEEVDIKIQDKDLRIDTYRASGAGGQHVNTTDSAVRITHLPTGIVVALQDEKSQHKNKAQALKILRSRVFDLERQKLELARSTTRKDQIGSGDRSEKIRTYNFPQDRISDHRVNITLYNIEEVIAKGQLDEIIEALITNDEAKRLAEIV